MCLYLSKNKQNEVVNENSKNLNCEIDALGTRQETRAILGDRKMEVIIDCSLLLDEEDFYTQLIKQVDFGEFFGRNLDAFWDYIGLLYEKK